MITYSYLGFTSTSKPRTAQIPRFEIGVTGGSVGSWDGIVATSGYHTSFGINAMEPLMQATDDWSGDPNDLLPVLATNWTIYEWPEEMNNHPTAPFINKGGLMAIELTLREGVTFHDGSAFNATVAKWNFDRMTVMSGNITGTIKDSDMVAYKSRSSYWLDAEAWVDYETASWNVSQYIGQPGTYAEFGTSEEAAMVGLYSRIKNVTLLEDLPSGGTFRINFNDWGGAHSSLLYVYDTLMISMDAYQNYFDLPIYGLGQDPAFPQPDISGGYPDPDDEFPGHMIGTGPYIFVEQEEHLVQGGWMKRNPNWWNSTAMQADGWHQVPEIGVVYFYDDTAGLAARSLSMINGIIDLVYDSTYYGRLVYEELVADPDINYFIQGYEATRTFITLNQINETYWKTWADLGPGNYPPEVQSRTDLHDIDLDGTIHVDGINRALRKALSYAFDYDTYINNVLGGRGVRSGGFLGVENVYYNSSIPIAYRNLTIARQALIDDPFWAPKVAARGLTINNATADWINIANTNPIFEFKLLWEVSTEPQANVISTSIKEIGIRLGGPDGEPDPLLRLDPDLYQVMIMRLSEFPAFTYHGVTTNWPDVNVGNTPVLDYYYKSPGLPYINGSGVHWPSYSGGQFFNVGFHYNSTVDRWLELMRFSDRATSQEIMNNLTIHCQTYQYPEIFISHSQWGFAINKDWEHSSVRGVQYAYIKYAGSPPSSPPGDIALSSDAGTPDIDGNFNLIWNVSVGADNYSIYRYGSPITQINGSLVLIADQVATSPSPISGLLDGEYYFVVVAYNQYGDTISNNIHVTVSKPGGVTPPGISGYNTLVILGMVIFTAVILFKRKKIKYKWK